MFIKNRKVWLAWLLIAAQVTIMALQPVTYAEEIPAAAKPETSSVAPAQEETVQTPKDEVIPDAKKEDITPGSEQTENIQEIPKETPSDESQAAVSETDKQSNPTSALKSNLSSAVIYNYQVSERTAAPGEEIPVVISFDASGEAEENYIVCAQFDAGVMEYVAAKASGGYTAECNGDQVLFRFTSKDAGAYQATFYVKFLPGVSYGTSSAIATRLYGSSRMDTPLAAKDAAQQVSGQVDFKTQRSYTTELIEHPDCYVYLNNDLYGEKGPLYFTSKVATTEQNTVRADKIEVKQYINSSYNGTTPSAESLTAYVGDSDTGISLKSGSAITVPAASGGQYSVQYTSPNCVKYIYTPAPGELVTALKFRTVINRVNVKNIPINQTWTYNLSDAVTVYYGNQTKVIDNTGNIDKIQMKKVSGGDKDVKAVSPTMKIEQTGDRDGTTAHPFAYDAANPSYPKVTGGELLKVSLEGNKVNGGRGFADYNIYSGDFKTNPGLIPQSVTPGYITCVDKDGATIQIVPSVYYETFAANMTALTYFKNWRAVPDLADLSGISSITMLKWSYGDIPGTITYVEKPTITYRVADNASGTVGSHSFASFTGTYYQDDVSSNTLSTPTTISSRYVYVKPARQVSLTKSVILDSESKTANNHVSGDYSYVPGETVSYEAKVTSNYDTLSHPIIIDTIDPHMDLTTFKLNTITSYTANGSLYSVPATKYTFAWLDENGNISASPTYRFKIEFLDTVVESTGTNLKPFRYTYSIKIGSTQAFETLLETAGDNGYRLEDTAHFYEGSLDQEIGSKHSGALVYQSKPQVDISLKTAAYTAGQEIPALGSGAWQKDGVTVSDRESDYIAYNISIRNDQYQVSSEGPDRGKAVVNPELLLDYVVNGSAAVYNDAPDQIYWYIAGEQMTGEVTHSRTNDSPAKTKYTLPGTLYPGQTLNLILVFKPNSPSGDTDTVQMKGYLSLGKQKYHISNYSAAANAKSEWWNGKNVYLNGGYCIYSTASYKVDHIARKVKVSRNVVNDTAGKTTVTYEDTLHHTVTVEGVSEEGVPLADFVELVSASQHYNDDLKVTMTSEGVPEDISVTVDKDEDFVYYFASNFPTYPYDSFHTRLTVHVKDKDGDDLVLHQGDQVTFRYSSTVKPYSDKANIRTADPTTLNVEVYNGMALIQKGAVRMEAEGTKKVTNTKWLPGSTQNDTAYTCYSTMHYEAVLINPQISAVTRTAATSINPGQAVTWDINVRNDIRAKSSIKDYLVVDVLPRGFRYKEAQIEPEQVIQNADGRTVLIWRMSGADYELKALGAQTAFSEYSFWVSAYAAAGQETYVSDFYLFPNTKFTAEYIAGQGSFASYPDVAALKSELGVSELSKDSIPQVLRAVKTNCLTPVIADEGFRIALGIAPGSSRVRPEEEVRYSMSVSSKSIEKDYSDLVLIQTLPRLGDTYLSMNSQRYSNMSLLFEGIADIRYTSVIDGESITRSLGSDEYKVWYCVDPDISSQQIPDADWAVDGDLRDVWSSEVPEHPEAVTAYRIQLDSSVVLNCNAMITVDAAGKLDAPEHIYQALDLKKDTVAVLPQMYANVNFGVAYNGGQIPVETASKAVQVSYNKAGGRIFADTNKNGILDEDETLAANQHITLLDKEGHVLQERTTDEEGYYYFENLAPGEYQLQLAVDDKYVLVSENMVVNGKRLVFAIAEEQLKSNLDIGLSEKEQGVDPTPTPGEEDEVDPTPPAENPGDPTPTPTVEGEEHEVTPTPTESPTTIQPYNPSTKQPQRPLTKPTKGQSIDQAGRSARTAVVKTGDNTESAMYFASMLGAVLVLYLLKRKEQH